MALWVGRREGLAPPRYFVFPLPVSWTFFSRGSWGCVCVCHADAVKSKQGAKFSNRIEVEGKNNKRPEITGGYYSTAKLTPNRIHPTPPTHVTYFRADRRILYSAYEREYMGGIIYLW